MASDNFKFDVTNAVMFKVLADNRKVSDSTPVMITAGMASGNSMMKMFLPYQVLTQAETITQKDAELKKKDDLIKANAQILQDTADENEMLTLRNRELRQDLEDSDAEKRRINTILKRAQTAAAADGDPAAKLEEVKRLLAGVGEQPPVFQKDAALLG
jgi:regulator of replication initiation timing